MASDILLTGFAMSLGVLVVAAFSRDFAQALHTTFDILFITGWLAFRYRGRAA